MDWSKRYPAINQPIQCEISRGKQLISFEYFALEVTAYPPLIELAFTSLLYTVI